MKAQDAVEAFREALELAPSEAAIYVHLCVAGPAKAGELAGTLKLHRNEVYRNAARLLQRGIIEMTLERPARYAAVRPEQVFDDALAQRIASIDHLKAARTRVLSMLHELEPAEAAEKRSVYKVIQGRQEIALAQAQAIEHARERIQWATTFAPSVRIADLTGNLDLLARRASEGIRVQAAIRTNDAGWAALRNSLGRAGGELRKITLDGDIRLMIVDGAELLMWVVNDPTDALKAKEEVAMLTTAPGFVQAEGVLFEQAWLSAEPSV